MAWLAALTLVAVVILALTGHAAGSASHEDAVNALGLHLLGVVVWVGGLLALVAMRRALGSDLGATVARYSTVAAWCFALVAVTGVQQAWIRLGSLGAVATAYGVGGRCSRRWPSWRSGCSAGCTAAASPPGSQPTRATGGRSPGWPSSRSPSWARPRAGRGARPAACRPCPTPRPRRAASSSSPGSPTRARSRPADWVTAWRLDWLLLGIAVARASASTSPGVVRLSRRGDHWPVARTICWVLGWVLFVWATSGAPGIWGRVLFSVHMVMHMAVAMIVPLLLVPGAPVTLALRALKARPDKTWGPREVLLQVVHSRAMRVLANPVVAAACSSSAWRCSTGPAVRAVADDPHGPPADAGPLPPHRVPLHLGAHRHRPRACRGGAR